jgi:hypothetical protein
MTSMYPKYMVKRHPQNINLISKGILDKFNLTTKWSSTMKSLIITCLILIAAITNSYATCPSTTYCDYCSDTKMTMTVYIPGEGNCQISFCYTSVECQQIEITCLPPMPRNYISPVFNAIFNWFKANCCKEEDQKSIYALYEPEMPCTDENGTCEPIEHTTCVFRICQNCEYGIWGEITECGCCLPCETCDDIWSPGHDDICNNNCDCKTILGLE